MTGPVSSDEEKRARERAPFPRPALLRDRSSNKYHVRLMDLSMAGFSAEAHPALDVGKLVWLTIPGLQGLEATVMWRRREIIGCEFSHPLHAAVFDHLVGRGR